MAGLLTSAGPEQTGGVTMVVDRTLKPGATEAFRDWVSGVGEAAGGFGGHLGCTLIEPAPDRAVLIVRFANWEDLEAWRESETCADWIARSEPLVADPPKVWTRTGLETWFTLPDRPTAGPPPPWKMALLTWLAIYPLIVLLSWALGPVLGAMVLPVRAAVMSGLLVPLMTWVVMPRVTRLAWNWLHA